MLAVLALIAITSTTPESSAGLVQASVAPPQAADGVTVVYLGCEVRQTLLSHCTVMNPDPVEPGTAAMALKLASGMSVSQALADRLQGRIVVKLNVKR